VASYLLAKISKSLNKRLNFKHINKNNRVVKYFFLLKRGVNWQKQYNENNQKQLKRGPFKKKNWKRAPISHQLHIHEEHYRVATIKLTNSLFQVTNMHMSFIRCSINPLHNTASNNCLLSIQQYNN